MVQVGRAFGGIRALSVGLARTALPPNRVLNDAIDAVMATCLMQTSQGAKNAMLATCLMRMSQNA